MWAGFVARLKRVDRQLWAYLALLAAFAWVLFWHLGTSPPGLSPADKTAVLASQNHHALFSSFINDPHNGFLYALQHFGIRSLFLFRLVSDVFAVIFIWCFFLVCRGWFGNFIAILATIMFATTPLILLSARAVEPAIMYLAVSPVIFLYLKFIRSSRSPNRWLLWGLAASSALALYTPGYVWILLVSLLFARRRLSNLLATMSKTQVLVATLIFIILLAPLGWSLGTAAGQLRGWLWLGPHLSQPLTVVKRVGWSAAALFWQSDTHHRLQINRLAVLNLAQIVLAVFGLYGLWQRARDKAIGFAGLILISIIGAAISADYNVLIIALFPLMILAAAGLRFLWLEWQSIFPRNPLPRGLAVVLICLLTVSSAAYGIRYSIIGWPHTLATRQTYVLK